MLKRFAGSFSSKNFNKFKAKKLIIIIIIIIEYKKIKWKNPVLRAWYWFFQNSN